MNQNITEKLALFAQNVQTIKKGFVWHHAGTKRLAALLYALQGKTIDCDAIRESHAVIKEKTGVFSMFRGNMSIFIAAMLSLDNGCVTNGISIHGGSQSKHLTPSGVRLPSAPTVSMSVCHRQRLSDVTDVYGMLKAAKFHASDYLAVAAYLIVADTDRANYQNTVDRARQFYDGMKKNNWFHTGQDDYIFATMLGLSDIDLDTGVERVNELYRRLKPEFTMAGGGSVQALSQMLTLGGKSDEALGHLLLLRNSLRSRRIKLDRAYTLPALGALSLLPVDGNTLVNDMYEAQKYLRAQKGFGLFSIMTQELLLFSSAIISSVYAKEMNDKVVAATSVSIVNIIIAQQVAMIVAVSAATSAAASS